ncbi:MAG: hypothetical protein KatS3mg105_4121 [Gemmatales bacterium]|nr:MAG: hypothetical protein KatS3mg105_4121 [Gemmatales bacterium]
MNPTKGDPSTKDAEALPRDLTGKKLGDFVILRRLGQGGMGQVYLAEQQSLKRKVALKVLRPDLAGSEISLKRFQVEATSAARLTHANIVQIYFIGEEDGIHYMALEYVEGINLREYIAKKGVPDLAQSLSIMKQVAAALARAGEAGIVHRDIKPENILLNRKGEAKVADFGLSRCFADEQAVNLTASGVTMGTPLYMSPEQVQGKPVDPRSDIYSFGVTCYHLLAGEPPFRGEGPFEVALKHVEATATPLQEIRPDLPAELCAIVEKMMAKNPDDRFQTARDVLSAINRVRNQLSMTQPMPATSPVKKKPTKLKRKRKPKWLWWAVPASFLLALIGGAGLAWKLHRPEPAPQTQSETPGPVDIKDPEVVTPPPIAELEEQLIEALAKADPSSRPEMKEFLSPLVQLLQHYVREPNEWEKGEEFFDRLEKTTNSPLVGEFIHLGKAILYARQDKTLESLEMFAYVFRGLETKPLIKKIVFSETSRLRPMVFLAMRQNLRNCREKDIPVPDDIKPFLRQIAPDGPRFPRPRFGND